MTGFRRAAALVTVLAVEAVLVAATLHHGPAYERNAWLLFGVTPVFALAVTLLARSGLPPRAALLLIIAAGALFQLLAMTRPPQTSDDDFRYYWDAKVQLSGIDPYRYAPQAPELAGLRDGFTFDSSDYCPQLVPGGCTAINRPSVPTIYPPVAEGAFALVRLASGGGRGGHLPLQLAAGFGAVAAAFLLARRALARGRSMWPVALWAWCPITISEFGNNAHIDWLAVLLAVLALTSEAARRSGLAGVLIGAAIATKLYPALVVPSLLRRRPMLLLGSATALVAMSYLPHVLAVGQHVVGYLPGYLREEHYVSGGRLRLLGTVLPHPFDHVVGALVVIGVALWARCHADPDAPEDTAVIVVGTALLVATPSDGWYAGLLLALIVMSCAMEWLPTAFAPSLAYVLSHRTSAWVPTLIYAMAATLPVLVLVGRRRRGVVAVGRVLAGRSS